VNSQVEPIKQPIIKALIKYLGRILFFQALKNRMTKDIATK